MEGIPYFYGVLTWSTFGTFSASRRSVLSHFSEVRGKIGNRRAQPFFATKPQVAEAQNRGLVGRPRFFPTLLETLYGSMRQIPETLSTLPFSSKETAGRSVAAFRCGRQVQNLPHTSELTQIGGVNVPARDRAGKCHFQKYISYLAVTQSAQSARCQSSRRRT